MSGAIDLATNAVCGEGLHVDLQLCKPQHLPCGTMNIANFPFFAGECCKSTVVIE